MKNTDFSSVKSSIYDKTQKTRTWVCTYMTVHLQMKKRNKKPPDGKTTRPLGVTLVPCFSHWPYFKQLVNREFLQNLSFYTPNILCLVVLLCALLSTRDHTAIHIFFQPTGYCCSEFCGQKSPPYLALLLS